MKFLILFPVLFLCACATTGNLATVANREITQIKKLKILKVRVPNKLQKIPTEEAAETRPTEEIVQKASEQAMQSPSEEHFFNATTVYDWEPSTVYKVLTAPNRITIIQLEPGEKIIAKGGGDTVRWVINETTSGQGQNAIRHVYLKPHRTGLKTNVFITTDRRLYQLEVSSHKDAFMASVAWNYGSAPIVTENEYDEEEALNPTADLKFENLNFKYGFVAKKKHYWMPVRVFDDGEKTFIEFPAKMQVNESPALFIISGTRESEIVNYRVQGNFYIIDRLIETAELRLGAELPQIVGIERLN